MRRRQHLFEGEDLLLLTRLHPRVLLGPVITLAVVAALAFVGMSALQSSQAGYAVRAVAAGGTAVVALRLAWRIVKWRSRKLMLTSARLLQVSGIMGRQTWSVPLAGISDVACRRSVLGRMLGYGELIVVTRGKIHRIEPLSNAKRVSNAILQALAPSRSAGALRSLPGSARKRRAETAKLPADPPEAPAEASVGAEGFEQSSRTRPLAEGRLQGRYLLVRKLAAGGMGAVYQGLDERLGRSVAVKVLREELAADPRLVERFAGEAHAVAALNHPNIASIFDYGEHEGTPYIVMELVAGEDVARVLERDGPLSPVRAAWIACQVLDALDHAHNAGVVHRDVKPANVILGAEDNVKVTDFGIARAAGQNRLTMTGALVGSAHYVAPEQVKGGPATPQSDIYSTGILLYEMLTGAPAFEGDSLVEILERHVADDVPPPSGTRPGVPPVLDEVVRAATGKDPAGRFAFAKEMADVLRRWLERRRSAPSAQRTPTTLLHMPTMLDTRGLPRLPP